MLPVGSRRLPVRVRRSAAGASLRLFVPVALAAAWAAPARGAVDLSSIRLPPGFAIEVWADGLVNARSLAAGDDGVVYVGTRTAGNVYAVRARADGTRESVTVLRGLNMPNGVAYRDGALYVAEVDRILRYDGIASRFADPPRPVVVATLPKERHHGWRYVAFGPDGLLYVAIGVPCNVCDRDKDDFATIVRMKPDGSGREVVARGVRNSVGFTWHPRTRQLWFTDNGRDMLGDDVPHCELNRVSRVGEHFGFPFCHGADVADPEFGTLGSCKASTPPVANLGPHVAPLGLVFYEGRQVPEAFRGNILIAEHGSWNRSQKIGYRITRVRLNGDRASGYEDFASGWLGADGKVSGRPVDLLQRDDGSLLVSDDLAGVVYRISYRGASDGARAGR
jgi:glucose/arabinose dehydrogenase